MGLCLLLAVFAPNPLARGLAVLGAVLWGAFALIVPRPNVAYLVATSSGLETRYFGLLSWDEIAALRVRQRRRGRSLEVYERDRAKTVRRARPRLLQAWMFLTQPLHLPLLRITERMASFDAVEFRAELERLAERPLPEH
jgi:hypothetical protein